MHMIRDRVIRGIVSPGQTRIVSGVDVLCGTEHRHRCEGWRKGADKQGHEQQPDDPSKPPHPALLLQSTIPGG